MYICVNASSETSKNHVYIFCHHKRTYTSSIANFLSVEVRIYYMKIYLQIITQVVFLIKCAA